MATLVAPVDDSLAGAVALAAAGDEIAFARIIQAHHGDMTRVCYVICGDLDVADEAAQAAWPIVWRKLGSLRDPGRLRPGSCRSRRMSSPAHSGRRRRTVVELAVADTRAVRRRSGGRVGDLDHQCTEQARSR
jgi:RNA polymerase sigma-70 factor (ECF subfamily)